jgi:flagellar protein FliT
MNSSEVLSMYENIAGLTNQMAAAARLGDWDGLSKLETDCATEARAASTGVATLSGAPRLRKIDLLKQILANDREIRDLTDPWMNQIPGMAHQ